jgi:hypothetical protein
MSAKPKAAKPKPAARPPIPQPTAAERAVAAARLEIAQEQARERDAKMGNLKQALCQLLDTIKEKVLAGTVTYVVGAYGNEARHGNSLRTTMALGDVSVTQVIGILDLVKDDIRIDYHDKAK